MTGWVGMAVRDLLCDFVKRSGAGYIEKTAPLVCV